MPATSTVKAPQEPIVIFRGVNGNGETYALEPRSSDRLRKQFGEQVNPHQRV